MVITTEVLSLLNIIPDADYWENCLVSYFALDKLDISLLPVDFFRWYSKDGRRFYCCLIPNIDVFWYAIFYIYMESLNIPFDVFKLQVFKHCIETFDSLPISFIENIDVQRVNWIKSLKKTDIPPLKEIVSKIEEAIVSKLKTTNIGKEAIEKYIEQCHKDSESQLDLLPDQSKTL